MFNSDADRMGLGSLNKRLKPSLFDPMDRPLCDHPTFDGTIDPSETTPRDVFVFVVKGHGVLVLTSKKGDPDSMMGSIFTNEEVRPPAQEPSHAVERSDAQIQGGLAAQRVKVRQDRD